MTLPSACVTPEAHDRSVLLQPLHLLPGVAVSAAYNITHPTLKAVAALSLFFIIVVDIIVIITINIIYPTLKAVAALTSGGELPSAAVMSSCFCRSRAAELL
jgi:hypothetical protein